MKKYIYILGGIVIIGGFFLIINSGESVKNPLNSNNSEKNAIKHIKNIEISSVSNNNIEKSTKKMIIYTTNQNISSIQNNGVEKSHIVNNIDNKKISQKIAIFIQNHNLQDIKDLPQGISIYAQNPPQKNEFTPPSPPTLIKVKFKDGSSIIPLNSNLINDNKKIYVVKKQNDKFVEIKTIDTKKLKSFTPPVIGQN